MTLQGQALLPLTVVTPADLARQNPTPDDPQEWDEHRLRLDGLFSTEGIEGIGLNVALEALNRQALTGLVVAGLGVTIYSEILVDFLRRNVEGR